MLSSSQELPPPPEICDSFIDNKNILNTAGVRVCECVCESERVRGVAVSASAPRVSDLFWGSLVLAHVYDFNLTEIYVELCVCVCARVCL